MWIQPTIHEYANVFQNILHPENQKMAYLGQGKMDTKDQNGNMPICVSTGYYCVYHHSAWAFVEKHFFFLNDDKLRNMQEQES